MKGYVHVAAGVALTVAVATTSGCALLIGGAAGAGAMAYARGDVRETVEAPLDGVKAAVEKVLADRKLVVKKTTISPNGVSYSATIQGPNVTPIDEAREKVSIECVPVTDRSTQVTIRVGTVGSPEAGRELMAALKKELK